jgi:hypothetical protein
MLDNFKTDILSSLSSQLDTFQAKKKKEEADLALAVFCPKSRKKYPLRECPLDIIKICGICEQNNDTKNCPSLPELKAIYQGATGETEQICFMAQKRPWPPKVPGMVQEQSQFPPYYTQYKYPQQNWYASMPWQQGQPQMQNQPWQQGWRGPSLQQPTPQTHPPIQHQQQLQLPSNQPPPRPTQLPAQPIPNPNNKVDQPACNVELPFFPTYVISPMEFQNIHLRSGRVVQDQTSPIIQEQDDEENPPKLENQEANTPKEKQNIPQKNFNE